MSVDYNPLAPKVRENPYPYYKMLRDQARVAFEEFFSRLRGFQLARKSGEPIDSFLIRGPRSWRTFAEPVR